MFIKILINLITFITILFILVFILKKRFSTFKKIFSIILFLIITWLILFSIDYTLTKNQKLPIFCTKLFGLFSYQDGGTIEYIGLGYKVIDFHKIVGGYSGWGEVYKLEEKYICPWFVSYEEAFSQIEQELFLENN